MLKALLDHEPPPFLVKLVSFACVTGTFLLHGTAVEWGLRAQNFLGVFKLFILAVVIGTGAVAFQWGIPTSSDVESEPQWRGRHNFNDI
jgi:amino acid transporter